MNAVKFLHTADWHVGKTLKGRDRLDEQRAVLAEIAQDRRGEPGRRGPGRRRRLRQSSAPSAQAQHLVVQTLLRLRQAGAEVIVIAGNHDHGPTFEAYRPLMGVAGITLAGAVRPPDKGGVIRFRARSDGAERAGGGAAVPDPALRGAGGRDRRADPVGERARLRRDDPPDRRSR